MTELLRAPGGWSPPSEFEEYRLVRPLGRGVMGEVHLAHDLLLDRPVAVKFVAGLEPTAYARERFFTEARAIARVQHPNVVAIHRVGQVRGRPYLVSEYIRGDSLEKLALPLPWERVSDIALALARGLAAAHRMQVLHRDLKPANAILTEDGEAKLVDFGLAVLLDSEETERSSTPPLDLARGRALEETLPLPAQVPLARTLAPERSSHVRGPVGTPLYMAPELWRGEPASLQSDVYALGALLYELCTGQAPFRGVPLTELPRALQEREPASLAERAPGVPAAFAALIDACLRRDPALRPRSGERVREALEELRESRSPVGLPDGNPYRGLQAYDTEHRGLFFGREREVRALLERLRTEPFVLVAGDSGVGKSSLCRAGVLPAVEEGALGGGLAWSVARVVPGRRPVAAVAAALAPMLELGEEQLVHQLRRDPASVARALRRRSHQGTLLFLDQLEELWTLAPPAEAAPVRELLAALAVRAPQVRVLGTLRSDFLTRLAAESGLGEELTSSLYLLRPLGPEGLREAIVGPARARGLHFESPELVDTLVAAAARSAGSLPLMQFALSELWEARDEARRLIPRSALERLGGVDAALARHADGVIAALPSRERAAAEHILTALVSAEGTRARRSEAELAPDAHARSALQALLRGRLLVACDGDEPSGAGFEIAHDALLGGWDTLRGWLGRDAEKRALRQRIERAAAEWERLGRGEEGLWTARQLLELRRAADVELGAREGDFIEASTRLVRRRRWVRRSLVLALPALLLLGLVGLRVRAQRDRDRAVDAQLAQADVALATASARAPLLEARRKEAFSLFDAGAWDAGEAAWREARRLAGERDSAYWRAGSALEAALQLHPAREDLRSRFADLTVLRILAAEQGHRREERAELLERLAAYDAGGERRQRLLRPAELRVSSRPAGARARLFAYAPDGSAGEPVELGPTPVAPRALAPGAYLLELEGADGPVRVPVRAEAGEPLALDIPLPARGRVPQGFLYVPAGSFGFGFGGDEDVRRGFFNAAPLHDVHTEAFLIGRHEVTFADWLTYLRALPPAERALRMPRARTYRNSLELKLRPDGRFELLLQPTTRAYRAVEGAPIRYDERDRRATQDWLRMPVAAVSFEDAQAYAAWLSRTGRVPGARLCDEREWERAARGADARAFPLGDALEPDDANFDRTYGRRPSAYGPDEVGSHPRSRSPVGADDMAGNVWEFTHSALDPNKPVMRGGSWYQGQLTARSVNREAYEPTARDTLVGLRLCAGVERILSDSP